MPDDDFLQQLKSICMVRHGEDVALLDKGFHDDNLNAWLVAYPASAQDVSAIVKLCAKHNVSIVPHGGRTGLAGAAVSEQGQLIIDMTAMNKIGDIETGSNTITVEAGASLQAVQEKCAEVGLTPGIDLAARGSATIGGMVSTNAGGMEAFRCGVMRHRVFGLEAVLPDGSVVQEMSSVSKANEGLDIKQLMIGAEGTLGVVTKVVLKLEKLPKAEASALTSFASVADAVSAFHMIEAKGNLLRAEIMWWDYADLVARDLGLEAVLKDFEPGHVLVLFEMAGDDQAQATANLEQALMEVADAELMSNAIIASNSRQAMDFWRIREESWSVEKVWPGGLWYDVSVPLQHLEGYSVGLAKKLQDIDPALFLSLMGHLGDGNLHITIAAPDGVTPDKAKVDKAVFDGVTEMGGSFSAEHGIGLEKKSAYATYACPGKRAAAALVKNALDPTNIMNPDKVYEQ